MTKTKMSLQLDDDVRRRLQIHILESGRSIRDQSEIVNEILCEYLDVHSIER
jgi:hypothetical protein